MGDREREADAPDERWRFLAALPIFAAVEEATLRGLDTQLVAVRLRAGDRLFADGDDPHGLVVVMCGSLRLVSASGTPPATVLLAPGSVFADQGLPVYVPTALEAAEPSHVLVIDWQALAALLQARPSVLESIVAGTARLVRQLQIASTPLFRTLGDTWSSHLAEHSEFVEVKRGDIIMREGDASDCVYLVVGGSLEAFRGGAPAASRVMAVLGDGASVGEMGVLMKEPRSLSVRARRDSTLIRVPAAVFERILHQSAHVTLQLASTLSERLKRTTASPHQPVPMTTIALLRSCEEPVFARFCDRLEQAFGRAGCRVSLLRHPPNGPGIDRDRLAATLTAEERTHDYVVCPCDLGSPEWASWSVLQADLVLVVADAATAQTTLRWPRELQEARAHGTRVELALLRGPGTSPRGAAAWLDSAEFHGHHHLVADSAPDHDRLVRRLSGRAWGLVLGGGGARGLAHIGVIRALREGGVPIDMIGGTSMGAILAAQYAMGSDDQQMLAMTRRAYVDGSRPSDLTVPFVALRTGRATIRTLKEMFADRMIEDLPIGYFCASCNLTRAQVEFHDRGPVWFWARVSCSVPGLLPPVPYHGDLLVDGGLLDNLPVAEMRRRLGGFVAAANVSVAVDLTVNARLVPEAPWSGAAQIARLLANQPRLPNIVDILMRTAEISSVRDSNVSGSPSDLYLHVPVEGIGMTDFRAIDRIVALGYEYTARRLEEHRRRQAHNTR